jgi:segregation and condensation protein B
MKTDELDKKIINIIFASGEGIDISNILKILNSKINNNESEENLESKNITDVKKEEVEEKINNIKNNLNNIGLELVVTKGNNSDFLSITTKAEYSNLLQTYFKVQIEEDLTPAQLQTLTIVAYLQEVSVQEVSFVRGVQSVQTLRALSTRGLVKKLGEKYFLTLEAFKILGISNNQDLKDFQKINENLKSKLKEALNG